MNYPNYQNMYMNRGYEPQPQPLYQQQYPSSFQPSQNPILWVNSKDDVEKYPVGNDCAVIFYKKDFKKLYLKKVDEFGSATIRIFDIYEEKEEKSVNDLLKRIENLETQILKENKRKKDDESDATLFDSTANKS